MQELEKLTYAFAIESASLIKSLEKMEPEQFEPLQQYKGHAAGVSLMFMDAMEAEANEGFANNLRSCLYHAQVAEEHLQELNTHEVAELNELKQSLIDKCKIIITKLTAITDKIIY
ncbi:MAG: hypothetical protein R6U66_07255 [Bacteroidales bacterium]